MMAEINDGGPADAMLAERAKLPTEDQPRDARVITGGQILDILSVCGEPEVMDIDDPAQKVRALIDAAIVHRALIAELVEALEASQSALAMLTEPKEIRTTSVQQAWAVAVDAELKARRALAKAKAESAP